MTTECSSSSPFKSVISWIWRAGRPEEALRTTLASSRPPVLRQSHTRLLPEAFIAVWAWTQAPRASAFSRCFLAERAQGIECALAVAALDGGPPFEALSYVWGPPSPSEPVVVNGITVEIGRNLHCALAALRYPDRRRRLRAAALYIDQKNDVEKSWQVAFMRDIYRHAERSLVFLGKEEDSACLFRFLNRPSGDGDEDETLEAAAASCGVSVVELLKSFISFARRPCFTRIWVDQEFALARVPPVWHCGP